MFGRSKTKIINITDNNINIKFFGFTIKVSTIFLYSYLCSCLCSKLCINSISISS